MSGDSKTRVFQVDNGVTATISGLTITGGGGTADRGGGLLNYHGNVTLANCTISGNTASNTGGGLASYGTASLIYCTISGNVAPGGAGLFSSGGTLTVTDSTITGSTTGIQVVSGASATISGGVVTKNTTGILAGANASDVCTVTVSKVDLAGNTVGIRNNGSKAVDAMLNWWGSAFGPTGTGASTTAGGVKFSPWLGDTASLTLPTPEALGFDGSGRYVVTPNPDGHNPNLSITPFGSQTPRWTVTPTGTIFFAVSAGSAGGVMINGEPGTDAFKMVINPPDPAGSSGAVYFVAKDAFAGAKVVLKGNVGVEVNAKGTANSFDVSAWAGAATLAAPAGTGTLSASTIGGYTLTNTSLASTDGMKLMLTAGQMTTANLTTLPTNGSPRVVVDASAFTGVTNLTAGGTGNAILYGGRGASTLKATGSGNDILIGGTVGPNTLSDTGTGFNILIGEGGKAPNTITGNGNDILISGRTNYDSKTDANIAALDAILAAWASSVNQPSDYTAKVNKIMSGITVGSNTYALNASTVKWNGQDNTINNGNKPTPYNWLLVNIAKDHYSLVTSQETTNIT